jgi:hypothetical protein
MFGGWQQQGSSDVPSLKPYPHIFFTGAVLRLESK